MTDNYYEENYDTFVSLHLKVAAHNSPDLSDEHLASIQKALKARFGTLNPKVANEKDMYASLCARLQAAADAARAVAPEAQAYVFKDISSWPEAGEDSFKPDLAMYPDTSAAKEGYSRDIPANAESHIARTAWAWMTMPIEAKNDRVSSAFHFKKGKGLLRDSDRGKLAQAQLANYANHVMRRQHRAFVFVLCICQTKARITRWDRSGCIVSKPFDYVKDPKKLYNFVYRLVLMSPAELGYDPTAVLATKDEVETLKKMKHANKYARERAEAILDPSTLILHPIYKIECPKVKGEGSLTCFIGKHQTATHTLMGRATRGYVTFLETRLGFMKDYWRPESKSGNIPRELDVYKLLSDNKICYVATAVAGEDIGGGTQQTVTDEYLSGSDAPCKRVHSRIVFEELARPLDEYENSAELIKIVYHGLLAHKEVWEKTNLLHRDVSKNNLMKVVDQDKEEEDEEEDTVKDVRGILIDWDMCKHKNALNQPPSHNNRSGTWPFMSALSLKYPLKPNVLADDLESFIYVVTYYSLRFHAHSLTEALPNTSGSALMKINSENTDLSNFVQNHFHHSVMRRNRTVWGGEDKLLRAQAGGLPWTFQTGHVTIALENLVTSLYALLKKHYSQIDLKSLEKYSGKDVRPALNPPPIRRRMPTKISTTPAATNSPINLGTNRQVSKPAVSVEAAHDRSNVFDSHLAILSAFETAVAELESSEESLLDKTVDQFVGLPEYTTVVPTRGSTLTGSSSRKRPATATSTGNTGSRRSKRLKVTKSYFEEGDGSDVESKGSDDDDSEGSDAAEYESEEQDE